MFWGKIKKETKGTTSPSGGATRGVEILKSQKGRDLCRVRGEGGIFLGFRKDNLTENLSDRESVLLVCKRCQGILREACISSTGEQFCSCCTKGEDQTHPNMHVRDTVLSLKCSCPLFQRSCEWLGTLGECENHLEVCSHVHEKCKLGCDMELPRHELKVHVSEKCKLREIPCEHCKKDFKACDMPNHIEKCPKMPLKCDLKCGTVMCREDMAHHLEKDCGRVIEQCKLGCGIALQRDELDMHVNTKCEQRMIPCEHCQTDFKVCDMPDHIEMCPKMPLKCDLKCDTVMCREDMAHHLEKDCGRVVEKCKLGCGIELSRDELDMHVNEKCVQRMIPCEYCHIDFKACEMTIHLVECPKMPLTCELGCGTVGCRNNMAQHIQEECVEKMIECPFRKYKCEVGLIKRKELNQHLEEKRTEHTELKLSAMEEIVMQQSEMMEQMSQEMELLKTEAKLNKEILKQISPKITNLYWKIKMEEKSWRRDLHYFFPTHVQQLFQTGRYIFTLMLEYTPGDNFVIKFHPKDGFDFDKLTRPFKAVFITSLICHDNPKYTKKLGGRLIEVQEQDYLSPPNTIAKCPRSVIAKEFIKDNCFDFEISVCFQ
ncbi:hypothetical protein LOD99_12247 [Oopsacas minuta]|uniref:Uncharacterized protein n=1 Tax=Oopsacas minuta TaxID=111878 RepID=A0AAV7JEJ8_9METZ|nr:hypothetical protein LOD99_12247 [Oopsacas minuta]